MIEILYGLNLENWKVKIRAGRKIAKYIKEALNDEFEMKPLVTRINMRKFRELMKENK